jgi:formylglycine-generating enzyme required for sulfatase activity
MWGNIRTEPYLRPLAERPLMLTMMADLHASRGGSLRGGRAELYDKSCELLLDRWNERRQGKTASEHLGMTPDEITKALEELAYKVHKTRGAEEPSEAAQIPASELWEALDSHRPKGKTVDERQVMDFLHQRSGILVADSPKLYRFPHRSYQEYLAGCYLVRTRFPQLLRDEVKADPSLWREVFLYAAAKVATTPFTVWALLKSLVPNGPDEPARGDERYVHALYAGMSVRESRLHESIEEEYKDDLEMISLWLHGILEVGALPPGERAEAGRVLAVLGDRRSGVGRQDNGSPDIDWVTIDRRPFPMGVEKRTVPVPAYRMSRFPVTNWQYRAFVEDGGYTDRWRECWSKEGWEWKAERTGPDDEIRKVFLLANHPRVNVSWFEAQAFCAWLAKNLGHEVRLPSEAEWEKVARGTDGRIYPWSNDFDANWCNASETGIGTTTAVGSFPDGTSPYGVHDMSGNVWEWCESKYGEKDKSPSASRVLRGGSFNYGERLVRCASRRANAPDFWHDLFGFRVSAPVSSETPISDPRRSDRDGRKKKKLR